MRPIIILLAAIMLSNFGMAQKITYDFAKMEDIDSKEIKKQIQPVQNGHVVMIEIDNINTFLYKVEIEGKQIELQTPIPSELQTLFRLPTEELETDAEEAQEGMEKSLEQLPAMKQVAAEAKSDELKSVMSTLIAKCEEYLEQAEKITEGISDIKLARVQLITIAKENSNYGEVQEKMGSVRIPNQDAMTRTYKEFEKSYYYVERLYIRAREQAEADVEKLEAQKKDLKDAGKDTSTVQENLTKAEKHRDKIEKALENIEEGYHKIESGHLLALIQDMVTLESGLNNPKNFKVISPPIQMEGDMVSYKVKVTPTKTHNLAPFKQVLQWDVSIPAVGGFKVDFSVGPAVSFGKKSRDQKLYLEADTLGQVTIMENDNNNVVRPAIAAMMHGYKRTNNFAAVGGMFGVGAGFAGGNTLDVNFYLGGSVILGKSQKVMLSGGVSYIKVQEVLAPQYEIGTRYPVDSISLDDITEEVYKATPFFSISYNITNRKEVN